MISGRDTRRAVVSRGVGMPMVGLAALLAVGCSGDADEGTPPAVALRTVDSFDEIADETERSKALFVEAGRVLQHPRCLNCHPSDAHPRQGALMAMHEPPVIRGEGGHGTEPMQCETCHQETNLDFAELPGHPSWHLAPSEMGWMGKSLGEICAQIKDTSFNGGMDLEALHEHMANAPLVGWGWTPGEGREPAPGTQASFGRLIEAWIDTGPHCPDGDAGARVVRASAASSDCAGCHEQESSAD